MKEIAPDAMTATTVTENARKLKFTQPVLFFDDELSIFTG
jgi:hypothetical protein